jgi:small-conductance mechanosensitive channel
MVPAQLVPTGPVPEPIDAAAEALAGAAVDLTWFLVAAALVLAVGYLLVVPGVVRAVETRNPNNPTVVDAAGTYLGVLLVVVAALAGLVAAGYGSVLSDSAVVVAAVTLVLGVAGQSLIGSLVSGLFLVSDAEFRVGDWIEWPDGAGRIERVGFRATRVRTGENEVVTVPNTLLTANQVSRPYGHDRVRATEEVLVAYDDDIGRARRALREVAWDVDGVLDSPAPSTAVEELGEDAVCLSVEFWVGEATVDRVGDVRSAVRARAVRKLREEGVSLAPPAGRDLDGTVTVERSE